MTAKIIDPNHLEVNRSSWHRTSSPYKDEYFYDIKENGHVIARVLERYLPIFKSYWMYAMQFKEELITSTGNPVNWHEAEQIHAYLDIHHGRLKYFLFDPGKIVVPEKHGTWHKTSGDYKDEYYYDIKWGVHTVFRVLSRFLPCFNRVWQQAYNTKSFLAMKVGYNHYFDSESSIAEAFSIQDISPKIAPRINQEDNSESDEVLETKPPGYFEVQENYFVKSELRIPSQAGAVIKISKKDAQHYQNMFWEAKLRNRQLEVNLTRLSFYLTKGKMSKFDPELINLHHPEDEDESSSSSRRSDDEIHPPSPKTEEKPPQLYPNPDPDQNPSDLTEPTVPSVPPVNPEYLVSGKNDGGTTKECLICFENNLEIMIEPCHHIPFCENCWKNKKLNHVKCPICDGTISDVQRVYI